MGEGEAESEAGVFGRVLPELLERILARLPRDDAIRSGLVCRRWQAIISSTGFSQVCARSAPVEGTTIFPAHFSEIPGNSRGIDVKQGRLRKLPRLPCAPSSKNSCVCSDKGLVVYLRARQEVWVANVVTEQSRKLPAPPLSSLFAEDENGVRRNARVADAQLQVDQDGQSYALLLVCVPIGACSSRSDGPAKLLRYQSRSQTWTTLPSSRYHPPEDPTFYYYAALACTTGNGLVYAVTVDAASPFTHFLVQFDLHRSRWSRVCEVPSVCGSLGRLVATDTSVLHVVDNGDIDPELFMVSKLDRHSNSMTFLTEVSLPKGVGVSEDISSWTALADGDTLLIYLPYSGIMAAFCSSLKQWHPWTATPRIQSLRGGRTEVLPCSFQLGLSTPI